MTIREGGASYTSSAHMTRFSSWHSCTTPRMSASLRFCPVGFPGFMTTTALTLMPSERQTKRCRARRCERVARGRHLLIAPRPERASSPVSPVPIPSSHSESNCNTHFRPPETAGSTRARLTLPLGRRTVPVWPCSCSACHGGVGWEERCRRSLRTEDIAGWG
jgi:hypothetical protein